MDEKQVCGTVVPRVEETGTPDFLDEEPVAETKIPHLRDEQAVDEQETDIADLLLDEQTQTDPAPIALKEQIQSLTSVVRNPDHYYISTKVVKLCANVLSRFGSTKYHADEFLQLEVQKFQVTSEHMNWITVYNLLFQLFKFWICI